MADFIINDDGTINIFDKKKKKESDKWDIRNATLAGQTKNNSWQQGVGEKEWYEQILQKPQAFEDGYQFGDVTKTVFGTAGDILSTGAKATWQNIYDIGMNVAGANYWALDKIGILPGAYDAFTDIERYKQDVAVVSDINKGVDKLNQATRNNSVLGEFSKNTLQSAVQSAEMAGLSKFSKLPLWQANSLATGFRNEYVNALNNGATKEQATISGLTSGISEVLTEYLFSGFIKLPGTGSGLDTALGKATEKIGNQFLRTAAQYGINIGGEAFEEVLSGFGSALGQKLTYLKDTDFKDIYSLEDALENAGAGALSALFGSANPQTIQNIRDGRNLVTGLTSTQQKYIDEIAQQRMVEAQKRNEKLGLIQKGKINQRTMTDFEKGRLADTNKLQQVNLPGLSNKDMDLQQSAYKYGINPNSEFVVTTKTMLDNRGIKSRFDADAFKNIKGNAYWTNNNGVREVVFNPNASEQAILEEIAIHELTHDLMSSENSKGIIENQKIIDYVKTLDGYKESRAKLEKLYSTQIEGMSKQKANALINEEIVADTLGKNIGSQEYIRRLIDDEPSIAKNIYDWVVNKVTNSKGVKNEKAYWNNVKNNFEKAYNMEYQGKENKENNNQAKYKIVNDKKYGRYWVVETEKDIFKGKTKKELPKSAFDYILNGNTNFETITDTLDGKKVKFVRISAKEYTRGRNSQNLNPNEYQQKMRLAPSVDDLINNAEIQYHSPLTHKNNMFKDGFNNYQGKVKIDDTYFRYIVRVGKAKNDNIFYDISLENLDTKKEANAVPGAKSTSPLKNLASRETNVPQSNDNVKSDKKYSMSEQLENQATNLVEEDIQTTNAMLDNFKSYLEEYDITNPTQEDIDNSLIDLLSYDNDMTPAETLKYEKQYKEVVNEYLKEQNQDVRYSLSETPTQDNQGRELTKGQQEYFKSEDANLLDENGNLKVLYHGTPYGKFTTFKGNMFFFSEDYGFADDYANSKSFEQALDGDINVVEAYIKAENVFDVTDSNDIQKLREALPNEMTYWGNTWDKETLLKKLQRKDTLPPKWKSEQIEGKQFGDYIGDDRNGYNTDMFVGVNEQNEIVYISQERDLQKLSQSEKDMFKEQLMSGKEVSYLTYQTVYGDMTKQGIQDKISDFQKQSEEYKKENGFENEAINYYIKELEQTLKWIDKDLVPTTKHKLIPKTTTQEATELTDIDNWTYFETAFDRATGKDVVDIIKDLGYDAINIYESGISNYIVFNPNQIKSVTNENPTDNPDIRKSQQNEGWQSFLDNNFEAKGTKTRLSDIKLPSLTNTIQEEVQKQTSNALLPIANELKELNNNLTKVMNPSEIAQLTPQDANTTPILPGINRNQVGDGRSSFFDNINNKVNMLNDEQKTAILNNDDVKYYDKVTNKDSLDKAFERLQENGQSESLRWFNKASESADATDVAEGWILLKQYADSGDTNGMVEVAKKLRDIGTKAGQTVQAFNILSRLTPEGMVKYAQSELLEAYDQMVKNKSAKWIEDNRSRFDLQPNEVQFIMDTMKEVSTMEDGYDKRFKLAQIQKVLTDKLPPAKGAGMKAWMRISMLFNPKTQVRNVAGNAVIAPVNAFGDMFASLADKVIGAKTGVRTTGNFNLKKYAQGMRTGLYQSYNDFKNGVNTRNIEGNRFEVTEGKSFNDNNAIGKALNRVDSLLSFMLDAGDRGFYEASFVNSINNQMVLNNTTEVTQEMIDIATQEALSRTWQDNNEYTKFVMNVRNGLNKLNIGGYGLGDVLIPFAKTPANLTKAIVEYSPTGLIGTINKGIKLNRSLTNGQYSAKTQHEFVQSLGKATAGTMLYILGIALANAGVTTGESDEDKDVSNFMKNTLGVNSYSIKIGDMSFTYDWAQPLAAPLAITANLVQKQKEEASLLENVVSTLDTAGNLLLEQSFMESISTVLNNNEGIATGMQEAILDLPARAIPTFLKQITDLTDGTQRQTFVKDKPIESMFNSIKAKIPGLSYTLDPSVDTLGREIQKYGGKNNLFNVFLNPANVSTENVSESAQEIYRLYKETGETNIMPRVAPYYVNKKGEKIILTTQQRTQYQKVSGAIIEENVANLLGSTAYQNMSDTKKAETINDIVNYSYNIAQNQVLGTELSETYETAYEYAQIGDISDFYEFRNSIDDTDADTKRTSIVNYLYNSDLEDNQIANLYGNYYSSDKTLNAMLELRIPMREFIKFNSADIQGQYNSKTGQTISGSKKNATIEYVNTLNLSKAQRAILVKSVYSSHKSNDNDIIRYVNTLPGTANEKKVLLKSIGFDAYDDDVFNYINSQNISKEEKIKKLKELGFTVRNGRVYY